ADEIRLRFIKREQLVLVGREAEEVRLLLHPFYRRALRAETHAVLAERGLLLGVVGFVAHRVPAGIAIEIDVAVLLHAPPDLLGRAMVLLLRGTDEAVEGDVEALVHRAETASVAGGEIGR